MAYRVSFVFSMTGDKVAQWTENFWNDNADPATALDSAKRLAPLLLGLKGSQTILKRIRLGTIDGTRRVAPFKYDDTRNAASGVAVDSDIPTTRVILNLYNLPSYRTHIWLGGIPDECVKAGKFKMTGDFSTAFKAFKTELLLAANKWSLNVLKAEDVWKTIGSITNAGVVTLDGHGYVTGDKVKVSGVAGIAGANREWLVTRNGANTFTLRGWGANHAGLETTEEGRVKRMDKGLVQITSCETGDATKHNVGRPS